MRIAVTLSLAASAFLLAPVAAKAAPPALSDHAAVTQELNGRAVQPVGWRKGRRCGRRNVRPYCCTWTCYPYYRPYQYNYWQFYYPYGGPLF